MNIVYVLTFIVVIIVAFALYFLMDSHINITGGVEVSESYKRYCIVNSLEDLILKYPNQYELHNILERFIITAYPNLTSPDAETNMITQLKEKRLPSIIYNKVLELIKNPPCAKLPVLKVSNNDNVVTFNYGILNFTMPKYRYDLLKKNGSDEDIVQCILEYASLMPSSQQWSIPLQEYKKYVLNAKTDVVEGFASPFNSQIMRLIDELPNKKLNFCSLAECDKQFGSLGNFFEQDFTGKTVIVNPPFIESILHSAAKKCLETLDKGDANFIFYGPAWYDSPFYELLDSDTIKQKYNVTKRILPKFKHSYEDLLTNKFIKATFNSVVFEVSNK